MSNPMDFDIDKVAEKIEKLMRLASNNPNEAEATSALAKAQEMLAAYNLDLATIEKKSGGAGKRVDSNFGGGHAKYQRQLWRSIAQLNFCYYWTQKVPSKQAADPRKRDRKWTHEHRLVGRSVNVTATKNMAVYLNETIERLCRERLHERASEDGSNPNSQFYSRWAIAYREGIADRVLEKIQDRRQQKIDEEEEKARKLREAAVKGASTSTALTLADLTQAEKEANDDFLYGEGYTAKRKAREAEWEAGREERRRKEAEQKAKAEQEYAEWAAAHPEEVAAEAKKERARERARERRAERGYGGRRYRFRATTEELRRESGGYSEGYKKGEGVSIDPQMDTGAGKKRLT